MSDSRLNLDARGPLDWQGALSWFAPARDTGRGAGPRRPLPSPHREPGRAKRHSASAQSVIETSGSVSKAPFPRLRSPRACAGCSIWMPTSRPSPIT